MNITDKPQHDPVCDIKMPDAHLRSALIAAEEVAGKQGMAVILRNAGLESLIDNYPPHNYKISGACSFEQYAKLNAALLTFFGRGGRSIVMRIGRKAYLLGSEQFATTVGPAAHAALKLLPEGMRAQKSLEMVKLGFDIFYRQPGAQVRFRVEDRGERLAYIAETCPICSGKLSDEKMCQLLTGFLLEGLHNVYGKEYQAMEMECRALGAPACVWEVSKLPKE